LRESRTIHAERAQGTVVRCGLTDTVLADIPVSVVFFFPQPLDGDRLAAGLATALDHLPVFGGRLRTSADDSLEIVCDNAGVPMTTYDVDETLGDAIGHVALAASGYVDHVDAVPARTGGHPCSPSASADWPTAAPPLAARGITRSATCRASWY